jgi:hypothetical protein
MTQMKRRIVNLTRILPCIAALLVFANCKNLFQPPELPPAAPVQTGEGTFTLKIGGIRAGRTILPEAGQNDFAAYTLVFQAEGKTDVSEEWTNFTLGQPISLPAGTWNLTVTAFMDSEKTKPAAQGSITGIEISGGGSTSSSLELTPLIEEGATGTFRWNINYPTDVTRASMTITPLDEATGTEAQTLYFRGGYPQTDKDNTDAPLELNTGYYRVEFNLSKGTITTGREEYLHIYKNLESRFEYVFTQDHFTVYWVVVNGDDSGPGSLRYAIENAAANSTIFVEVETINLESMLQINKNLTIRGNGVTLTRSATMTTDDISNLLQIYDRSAAITVNISRVHFKNGRATTYGAAVFNSGKTVNLESCIFSGNQSSASSANGGAIYNSGTMRVKGCTFYNNSSTGYGGAVYNYSGTLTLTGNLFYGNTANYSTNGPVVYNAGGTVTSLGYNAVDVALGAGTDQSGWTAGTEDKTITAGTLPVSPVSFRLLSGGEAANVITTLPTGYPQADFYGAAIANGAAAGAVQGTASGSGYFLVLGVNGGAEDAISATPAPDADGYVSPGPVAITASPADGNFLAYWLVDGVKNTSPSPLNLTISDHTVVQAVFGILVTDFTDTANSAATPGTLRYALANIGDGGTIRFTGVTAGSSTIELTGVLMIAKSVTIEGDGVTLTRSAAWTAISDTSQLLYIIDSADTTVNISRVHFKNGRATNYGAAIRNGGGDANGNRRGARVSLESCIFSGNQYTSLSLSDTYHGAIYNDGRMSVNGCTFYNNGIYTVDGQGRSLTRTGNLSYGNGSWNYASNTVTSNEIFATTLPVSPLSFRLLENSEAANVITTLPAGYPQTDFYGDAIADGAAAGAVQSAVSGSGYYFELGVNESSWGSVSVTPAPDAEGIVPAGTVTLTASPAEGYDLINWLVNGAAYGSANPLSFTIAASTNVQAVFGRVVTVTNFTDATGSDATPGTLRYALTNAQDWDIIRFTGLTAGTTTIELGSALPQITKSVTIEGNGVTLTRSASWTATGNDTQLLRINAFDSVSGSSFDIKVVNISRVHFKNGRATSSGAAIYNDGGITVNLESCIFSGNETSQFNANGGAIYSRGKDMSVKGCTFYNNRSSGGGSHGGGGAAISHVSTSGVGRLTLTGNLFYGNTAAEYPVVHYYSNTVTSSGYNVADVALGTGTAQSGWTAADGDTTFTALSISGVPFNTTTFAPVTELHSLLPSTAPEGFPAVDFNGAARTWPGAPGAVKQSQ